MPLTVAIRVKGGTPSDGAAAAQTCTLSSQTIAPRRRGEMIFSSQCKRSRRLTMIVWVQVVVWLSASKKVQLARTVFGPSSGSGTRTLNRPATGVKGMPLTLHESRSGSRPPSVLTMPVTVTLSSKVEISEGGEVIVKTHLNWAWERVVQSRKKIPPSMARKKFMARLHLLRIKIKMPDYGRKFITTSLQARPRLLNDNFVLKANALPGVLIHSNFR
jgi:hypothetical protein